jgi:tetratricopeptide (TPR) repeat protein
LKSILAAVALAGLSFSTMAILLGVDTSPVTEAPGTPPSKESAAPPTELTGARTAGTDADAAQKHPDLIGNQPNETTQSASYTLRQDYRALFQMGDYTSAIQLIESSLAQHPDNQALSKDLAVALYAAAFTDFERKDYAAAQEKLRRSLALGHEAARPALARILALRGDKSEALRLAEEHYRLAPNPDALEAVIDAHLNLENHEETAELLEDYHRRFNKGSQLAAEANAQSPDAVTQARIESFWRSRKQRLELRAALKENQMVIRRSGLELFFFEAAAERLADAITDELSISLEALRSRFGNLPWGAPMVVWLVQKEGFRAATGAPPWAGALFDGIMRLPYSAQALDSANGPTHSREWPHLRQMVYHESTHAYLAALCGDRIPSWLGEGLAQMHEGRSAQTARQALMQTYGSAWRTLQPGEDLSAPFTSVESTDLVRSLYNRALVLTHDLETRSQMGSEVWRRFLADLCLNELPFHDALEVTFGSRGVEQLWRAVR